jgi:hypothetical protein
VRQRYHEDNPLLGVMMWMIADPTRPENERDPYTICPSCTDDIAALRTMCGCE